MRGDQRARELGAFLQARRRALRPSAAGFPGDEAYRRTTGLRREEVAELAYISVNFYTRIEQGRRSASEGVLNAIADALCLNDQERKYVIELSQQFGASDHEYPLEEVPRPVYRTMLEATGMPPTLVIGRRMDVLGWNQAFTRLGFDFAQVPPAERNIVWLAFVNEEYRSLQVYPVDGGRAAVGILRREYSMTPWSASLKELVDNLSARSEEFRRCWSEHTVAFRESGITHWNHPEMGPIAMQWEVLRSDIDSAQTLWIFDGEPGSELARRLREG